MSDRPVVVSRADFDELLERLESGRFRPYEKTNPLGFVAIVHSPKVQNGVSGVPILRKCD